MKNLFVLLFTFMVLGGKTQEPPQRISDSAVIKVMDETRRFVVDQLHLETGDDFYAWEIDSLTGQIQAQTVKNMYCYVYAWDPRTKRSPLKSAFRHFGTDEKTAGIFRDSLKTKGYETMLYKTAGTSAAKITARMLEYSPMSICFIMLHEAVHRHRANTNSPLPYVFEEALCDLVANQHVVELKQVSFENSPLAFVYLGTNEKLYRLINDAAAGKIGIKKCNRKVKKILVQGDSFQRDRFGYTVNHAYLERYRSYCKHYFLLKKALYKSKDLQTFFKKVFALKGTEEEVERELKKMAGE